jgi:hypothetical protein
LDSIHILDEVVVEQSRLAELRSAFFERYLPSAGARGMKLAGAWQSPAIELPGRPVTMYFLWSLDDLGAFWRMRLGAGFGDPGAEPVWEGEDKEQWWLFVDGICSSRRRSVMTDMAETGIHV